MYVNTVGEGVEFVTHYALHHRLIYAAVRGYRESMPAVVRQVIHAELFKSRVVHLLNEVVIVKRLVSGKVLYKIFAVVGKL